jgi:hypothetical protein
MLADGTQVYGSFDGTPQQGYTRHSCVAIDTEAWGFSVSNETISGQNESNTISIDGASLAELQALRDFLNSGAFERMTALAIAWGRGDDEPPAIVPSIRVEPFIFESDGKPIGMSYHSDNGTDRDRCEVFIPTDISNSHEHPRFYFFGYDLINLDHIEEVLPRLMALLNDPRVKAARAVWRAAYTAKFGE